MLRKFYIPPQELANLVLHKVINMVTNKNSILSNPLKFK